MKRRSKRSSFSKEDLRNKAFERKKVSQRTNACAADFSEDENQCVEPIIDGEEVIVGGLIKAVFKDADTSTVVLTLEDIDGGRVTVLMSEENYDRNQSRIQNSSGVPVIIRGIARKVGENRSVLIGVDVLYEKLEHNSERSYYYIFDNSVEIVKGTKDADGLICDSGLSKFQLENRCFERYFEPENAAVRARDIALLKMGEWESYMKEKVSLSCVSDADAICCVKGVHSDPWSGEDLLYYTSIIFPLTGKLRSPIFAPYKLVNQHVDYEAQDDDDDYDDYDDEFGGYCIDETRTYRDTVLVERYIQCLESCKRENLTKIIFVEKEEIPEGYLQREFTRGSIFKKAKELGVEFEVKVKKWCYSLEVEPEQKLYELLAELVEAMTLKQRQLTNKRINTDYFSHLYAFRRRWEKEIKTRAVDSYIYKFFDEDNEDSTIDGLMEFGAEVYNFFK